eukprot:1159659-Pelagomonas_calceolata.AAC.5
MTVRLEITHNILAFTCKRIQNGWCAWLLVRLAMVRWCEHSCTSVHKSGDAQVHPRLLVRLAMVQWCYHSCTHVHKLGVAQVRPWLLVRLAMVQWYEHTCSQNRCCASAPTVPSETGYSMMA